MLLGDVVPEQSTQVSPSGSARVVLAIRLPARLQGAIRQARMVAGRHSAAGSASGRHPASCFGNGGPWE